MGGNVTSAESDDSVIKNVSGDSGEEDSDGSGGLYYEGV